MASVLITYELLSPEKKDYRPFFQELEASGRRVLPAAWITKKATAKEDVVKTLWPLLDQQDRLLVVEIADPVGLNLLA